MSPEAEPKPAVISVGIERVDEDYVQRLRAHPYQRLTPLDPSKCSPRLAAHFLVVDAINKEMVDLQEDILRQHDEKGYALARVEHLDNGKKRLFRLPEEETA